MGTSSNNIEFNLTRSVYQRALLLAFSTAQPAHMKVRLGFGHHEREQIMLANLLPDRHGRWNR